jgi:hypothetical protein
MNKQLQRFDFFDNDRRHFELDFAWKRLLKPAHHSQEPGIPDLTQVILTGAFASRGLRFWLRPR